MPRSPSWSPFCGRPIPPVDPVEVMGERAGRHANRRLDLADVVGQAEAKWACEVAAAGRHHLLFHGPPGVGKTMLAERVPGLLPDLDLPDALEVSAVHSLAGFNLADELITRPPYSDPHHSASVASIVGGGQRMARPGAISCAHKGVLFLDDSTEPQSIRSRHDFIPARCHRNNRCLPSTFASKPAAYPLYGGDDAMWSQVGPTDEMGVSDERCESPNTLSCGLARKGRYDRNTGGRESTIIEASS